MTLSSHSHFYMTISSFSIQHPYAACLYPYPCLSTAINVMNRPGLFRLHTVRLEWAHAISAGGSETVTCSKRRMSQYWSHYPFLYLSYCLLRQSMQNSCLKPQKIQIKILDEQENSKIKICNITLVPKS